MPRLGLLLRWSWRDLRRRWLQVAAIALLLSIGLGMYAGLGSTAEWRYVSNDASYELLAMHDLRVELAPGSLAPAGALAGVVSGLGPEVSAVEERLMLPTQVRIEAGGHEILARGRIVGLDLAGGPPEVNRLHVFEGRGLQPGDDGRPVAVLERSFAAYHGLPTAGRLVLAGGVEVDYVGHGVTPEFFYVLGDGLELFAQATYAVVFVPLSSAQAAVGGPLVNDLVLRLVPDADPEQVRRRLVDALAAQLPEVSATVTTRSEDPAHHILYEDIEGDQKVWNVIAFLILAGGTLAAFNLASRVIEAQRREIGVSMAIGAPPPVIALRPLLFGIQVGLLGVAGGVGVGFAAAAGMRRLLVAFLPLPVWITDFQVDVFTRAAVFGLLLPVLATAYPVWRALRVEPVEALRHVATRHGGASRLGTRMPLPGGTIDQVPVRNLLRNPRRTVLTVVAIGAALTTVVAIVGLLDTFGRTLDDYGAELAGDSPGRVTATLAGFQPVDGPVVASIASRPGVAAVEPSVQLPATAISGAGEIGLLVSLVDPEQGLWSPTVVRGNPPSGDGIVISATAAADLGVEPGDSLVLRHPSRQGETAFTLVDTPITVAGIHPGPVRPTAYLHRAAAGTFGMEGLANMVQVAPIAGVGPDRLRNELFDVAGVATVVSVTAVTDSLDEALDLFEGVLQLGVVSVLALALLIAFNTASISADERAREHATMFAFGMRTRSVLRILMVESALLGVAGTAFGIAAGYAVLHWMVSTLLTETMPEFGMTVHLAGSSLATVVGLGVLAVALAPLLTIRKLHRMDIPGTLRVVE